MMGGRGRILLLIRPAVVIFACNDSPRVRKGKKEIKKRNKKIK
jgi:hypothetical protein